MNHTLAKELQMHLDLGEELIWVGQPQKGILFRSHDIFLIPFSIAWCGFAIFWYVGALNSGAPFLFAIKTMSSKIIELQRTKP